MTENLQPVIQPFPSQARRPFRARRMAQVPTAGADTSFVNVMGGGLRGARDEDRRPDRGTTFVELLVSIVLLGTAVAAILVTLRTSTHASGIDQNLAKGYEWIQSVSDQIYDTNRVPCYAGGSPAAIAAYQTAANGAQKPPGWSAGNVTVTNVEFLGRALPGDPFSWDASFCFESNVTTDPYYTSPLYTQRVTFTVNGPPSTISLTMQVVKSEK